MHTAVSRCSSRASSRRGSAEGSLAEGSEELAAFEGAARRMYIKPGGVVSHCGSYCSDNGMQPDACNCGVCGSGVCGIMLDFCAAPWWCDCARW